MHENDWLAERFDENRAHLLAVAFRMLGSRSEADDAVQEAWLRLSRSDSRGIENLGGWLTTVLARVCLDLLRSRKSRREEPLIASAPEPIADHADGSHPEHEVLLAESVHLAMLVVLETLTPAERVAFVLHDIFDLPFDEIAPIVGRTPTAARQLASRARRRVQGTTAPPDAARHSQRTLVDAFRKAARSGDFAGLLAILDPQIVLRADATAVGFGAEKETVGASAVAKTFSGRAAAAKFALVEDAPGLAWVVDGKPRVVFQFTVAHGKIVAIDLLADPNRLAQMDLAILED